MKHLILGALSSVVCVASVAEAENPTPERIQAVRKTYRAVPPDILGVKEPVRVQWSGLHFDGETMFVKAEDADHRVFYVTLQPDESGLQLDAENEAAWIGNHQTGRIQFGFGENMQRGPHYPVRGPEEAALYGLLIRWSEQPKYAGVEERLQNHQEHWTELFVKVMDQRFASVPAE